MNKVKICPFCGGQACLHSIYEREPDLYYVFIRCTICGAEGKKIPSWERPAECEWSNNPCDLASAAWNMRIGRA